jgi:hypothetical protein
VWAVSVYHHLSAADATGRAADTAPAHAADASGGAGARVEATDRRRVRRRRRRRHGMRVRWRVGQSVRRWRVWRRMWHRVRRTAWRTATRQRARVCRRGSGLMRGPRRYGWRGRSRGHHHLALLLLLLPRWRRCWSSVGRRVSVAHWRGQVRGDRRRALPRAHARARIGRAHGAAREERGGAVGAVVERIEALDGVHTAQGSGCAREAGGFACGMGGVGIR